MPGASTASTYQLREEPADGLVEDGVAPDALDDDGGRDLALAEARDAQVAPELAGGAVERALDLGGGHLRLDADARLGQLGDGGR